MHVAKNKHQIRARDYSEWCICFFDAWHIKQWIDMKGGWVRNPMHTLWICLFENRVGLLGTRTDTMTILFFVLFLVS